MATTTEVTAGGEDHLVYGDEDGWDVYFSGHAAAAEWEAADTDARMKALVTARRTLDRQLWLGSKTDPDQLYQWPRSGVSGVDEDEVPLAIIEAQYELALALLQGNDFLSAQNQSQKIASLRAGSVAISYFRGADGAEYRFPLTVQELIGEYLSGSGSVGAVPTASGVDGESSTRRDYTLTQGR